MRFAICLIVSLFAASAHAEPRIGFAKINDAWTLWLRGDELNGQFDTVDVSVSAHPFNDSPFTNLDTGNIGGVPRTPGDPFTYRSRVLDQDPLDGGLGWSIVGQTINANVMAFAGGPLGQKIDTSGGPQGWLFMGNFYTEPPGPLPRVGGGGVQLINGGTVVAELLFVSPIIPNPLVPEPASGVLLALCLLMLRRRNV